MSHYGNSYRKALMALFPDIGLDFSKFSKMSQNYCKNVDNQRGFFIDFAREQGFDPRNADMWYKISRRKILTQKVFLFCFTPFCILFSDFMVSGWGRNNAILH